VPWTLGWFIGRRVRLFELTRPFRYVMTSGDVITVPAGYRTDGASIPRRLQDIFPPFGAWVEAALIHDYLCTRGLEGRSVAVSRPHFGPQSRRFTARDTHSLWAKMLTQVPAAHLITPWQRTRMTWAVQTFGPRWTFTN
jgi:hypothetical protein